MRTPRAFVAAEAVSLSVVGLLAGATLCVAVESGRASSRTATTAQNMRSSGLAIFQMAEDNGLFGPAYAYGSDPTSVNWNIADQSDFNSGLNGYVHWSGVALAGGYAATESIFTSPDAPRGGVPRTNPGIDPLDWDPGQVNTFGAGPAAPSPRDRQAERLAFTVNHAIMARNKLVASGTPRLNRIVGAAEIGYGASPNCVRSSGSARIPGSASGPSGAGAATGVEPSGIGSPSRMILLAEWGFDSGFGWRALATNNGGGDLYKSHRPVTPFVGVSSGTNVYAEPNSPGIARYRYPTLAELAPLGPDAFAAQSELSAIGRHRAGGTSLFGTLDGAVVQMTVEQTISGRMWGDRFHAITGNNAVQP